MTTSSETNQTDK